MKARDHAARTAGGRLRTDRRSRRRAGALAAMLTMGGGAAALALAGGAQASNPPRVYAKAAAKGSVATLYAGSLVDYMQHDFGPYFEKKIGYAFEGFGGGSGELVQQIKGGVHVGDVFISAAAEQDHELEGAANGNWVSWYSTFAASPLELAYDPESKFGKELAAGKPWWKVIGEPGIQVGRTDPKLDPKGRLTVEAIEAVAKKEHDPELVQASESFPVFPETALVGRLQAGQLDAGFFYAVEAKAAGLKTVPIKPVYKVANYTITILNKDPDPTGAAELVKFLLDTQRSYTLKKNGIDPIKAEFSGNESAVPASLRKIVGAEPATKKKPPKKTRKKPGRKK